MRTGGGSAFSSCLLTAALGIENDDLSLQTGTRWCVLFNIEYGP